MNKDTDKSGAWVEVERFLRSRHSQGVIERGRASADTARSYGKTLRAFVRFCDVQFGVLGAEAVRRLHIEEWLVANRDRPGGWSAATTGHHLSCVRSFFRWMVEEGRLALSPADGIRSPRREAVAKRALRGEDLDRLLAWLRSGARTKRVYAPLIEFMARTGARAGEVCAMDREDWSFDLDGHGLHVVLTGKGNKKRALHHVGTAGEACEGERRAFVGRMLEYRSWRDARHVDERALWLSGRGSRLCRETLGARMRAWGKVLGLEGYTAHCLRHGFVTSLLAAGTDVATVSELVGHANPQVTMAVYAHTDERKKEEALGGVF